MCESTHENAYVRTCVVRCVGETFQLEHSYYIASYLLHGTFGWLECLAAVQVILAWCILITCWQKCGSGSNSDIQLWLEMAVRGSVVWLACDAWYRSITDRLERQTIQHQQAHIPLFSKFWSVFGQGGCLWMRFSNANFGTLTLDAQF